MASTFSAVVQRLQDLLVNDPSLSDHLDSYIKETYPLLEPVEVRADNETIESMYYGLRNERMLLILATVMSNLGPKE